MYEIPWEIPNSFIDKMYQFYTEQLLVDCDIHRDGHVIKVHKCILAACSSVWKVRKLGY